MTDGSPATVGKRESNYAPVMACSITTCTMICLAGLWTGGLRCTKVKLCVVCVLIDLLTEKCLVFYRGGLFTLCCPAS